MKVAALEGLLQARNQDSKKQVTGATELEALHEEAQTRSERGLRNGQKLCRKRAI